jgi:NAD+ kinase
LRGEYEEESRAMLAGRRAARRAMALRPSSKGFAINEVVVSRGATASMVELRAEIGGQFVANYRADGLLVSSPTGSTAYALSAGGPILHPRHGRLGDGADCLAHLSNRPIWWCPTMSPSPSRSWPAGTPA